MSLSILCSLSVVCAPAMSGGTLVVPDDYPSLAGAVSAAASGDTIVVRTDVPQNASGPVILDKSLTIRGEPICNFRLNDHALILNGPADGRLELENVAMAYESHPNPDANVALAGPGFEEVVLKNCRIVHDNIAITKPIEVTSPATFLPDVKRVVLLDSVLVGSAVGHPDECIVFLGNFMDQAATGLVAPNADVVLLASEVSGGRGGYIETAVWPCPGDIADWPGKGGVGLIAKSLTRTNADVTSGPSAQWTSVFPNLCDDPATSCGVVYEPVVLEVSGNLTERAASLLATPPGVSLTGGTQTLDLVADPIHANALYFVAGSFSGSSPGFPLGPLTVPLATPDPYFDYTLTNFNGPILGESMGNLDANGRARATVTLGSALPSSLIGLTATHAFVLFDASLTPAATSNAATLKVLP